MLTFVGGVLVAVLLTAAPAAAAPRAQLQEVVAALEGAYAGIKDVQAEFSQRTAVAALKREERGGGELLLKMSAGGSARFRFDYRKPKQLIVSDGTTVWFYLPEEKQVMVGDVAQVVGSGTVALNYLTGIGRVSKDFRVSFVGEGRDRKGNYLLELVPRQAGQMVAKLQLTVAADAVEQYRSSGRVEGVFPVVASVLHDQFGNRTTIEFSRVRVNQGLPDSRFSFKAPAGVEVIRQ